MKTLLAILQKAGGWRPNLYVKIENPPYLPLVIEAVDESGPLFGFSRSLIPLVVQPRSPATRQESSSEGVTKLIDKLESRNEHRRMRMRTKLCFLAAALFFVAFGLGISERGSDS